VVAVSLKKNFFEAEDGRLHFAPTLLEAAELLGDGATFAYVDPSGRPRTLDVPKGGLAFTLCQVPVVYRRADADDPVAIRVIGADGSVREVPGRSLDRETSRHLFERRATIARIEVALPASAFRAPRP
jgi:hypothetical protein